MKKEIEPNVRPISPELARIIWRMFEAVCKAEPERKGDNDGKSSVA